MIRRQGPLRSQLMSLAGGVCIGVLLVGWTTAASAESGLDTITDTLQLHGNIDTQSILRNDSFVRDYHVASFRNRLDLQLSGVLAKEAELPLAPGARIEYFIQLRPGYEGIYDVYPDRFGNNLSNFSGVGKPVSHDATTQGLLQAFGYDPHQFKVVGQPGNPGEPGFFFGVPLAPNARFLKPCINCVDVNLSENDLRWEKNYGNSLYYPLREAYFDIYWDWMGRNWLRLGKQQIVWGKADFFRLQDIVNPVDFSQHFFIEPFEDTRVPQWSAQLQHRFGNIGPFTDVALTGVWNFDRFTPVGLGQAGQPWAVTFGDLKRSFAFNNGLFANALVANPADVNNIDFALAQENLPDWSIRNSGVGARLDWQLPDPQIRFSLTDYFAYRDTPAFGFTKLNVIEGSPGLPASGGRTVNLAPSGPGGPIVPVRVISPSAIKLPAGVRPDQYLNQHVLGARTEIFYRKVNTLGVSADYFEPITGLVIRTEGSWTANAIINDTDSLTWMSDNDILAWVVGFDRNVFIRPLNPDRAFFTSFQVFGRHEPGAHSTDGGRKGTVDGLNSYTFTAFIQGHYWRDQLTPLVFAAYGAEGTDATIGGNLEWLITNHWSALIAFDAFVGRQNVHDVGPFALFKAGPPVSEVPFGFAHEQSGGQQRGADDEFWGRIRYRF